jgi:hypothetical protein
VLEGSALEGPALEGPALEDPVFDGADVVDGVDVPAGAVAVPDPVVPPP